MILTAIRALRRGAAIQNPTPFKWAGVAVTVALIGLNVAQSYGFLTGISETDWIELVMAALLIYAQIATTTKIGILPEPKTLRVDEVIANVGYPPNCTLGYVHGPQPDAVDALETKMHRNTLSDEATVLDSLSRDELIERLRR